VSIPPLELEYKMNKVYIVIDMSEGMGPRTILRVFAQERDALAYGRQMVEDGTIEEFDVYEREVYK
jgi:hypothetical protein